MTVRWYIDTEFHEDGRIVDLISIGVIGRDRDGNTRSFYAVSNEFDESVCNDFVKANVLPKLPPMSSRAPRAKIARELRAFIEHFSPRLPKNKRGVEMLDVEFWGYFADYDWLVLCQLFGRMIDLPPGWPWFCRDIMQLISEHKIPGPALPVLNPHEAHDALVDATWTMRSHEFILEVVAERARQQQRLDRDELEQLRAIAREADAFVTSIMRSTASFDPKPLRKSIDTYVENFHEHWKNADEESECT